MNKSFICFDNDCKSKNILLDFNDGYICKDCGLVQENLIVFDYILNDTNNIYYSQNFKPKKIYDRFNYLLKRAQEKGIMIKKKDEQPMNELMLKINNKYSSSVNKDKYCRKKWISNDYMLRFLLEKFNYPKNEINKVKEIQTPKIKKQYEKFFSNIL